MFLSPSSSLCALKEVVFIRATRSVRRRRRKRPLSTSSREEEEEQPAKRKRTDNDSTSVSKTPVKDEPKSREEVEDSPILEKLDNAKKGSHPAEDTPSAPLSADVPARKGQLILGVNAVTRLLERGALEAGLLCSSSPRVLTQHLLPLAAARGVAFASVPELSGLVREVLGVKRSMCLGVKVGTGPGWKCPLFTFKAISRSFRCLFCIAPLFIFAVDSLNPDDYD